MDVDSKCTVPTEANLLKQTKVSYRRVELCSNTKLHGANPNLVKREISHGVVLKYGEAEILPLLIGHHLL